MPSRVVNVLSVFDYIMCCFAFSLDSLIQKAFGYVLFMSRNILACVATL